MARGTPTLWSMTDDAPLTRDEINSKYGSASPQTPANPWVRALGVIGLILVALSLVLMMVGMSQREPLLISLGGTAGTWGGFAILLWLTVRALSWKRD